MDCRNIRHFIAVGIILLRCHCSGFNVDVASPIVRFDPQLPDRSGSLFGYSVAFHRGGDSQFSMLIGAPRAQTSQPDVERGGAVYRCPVASNDCEQVGFDTTGQPVNGLGDIIGSKSNQFFGATLHSTDEPGGPVVACAPRRIWSVERFNSSDSQRFLTGACFVASNDFGNIQEYTPCEQKEVTDPSTLGVSKISYCQAGFSASVSEDGKLLLGAPGSFYWQGQLIFIDPSRPDDVVYTLEKDYFFDNFYQGYTVTRGRFGARGIYAVAEPRANDFLGIISFFDEDLGPVGTIEGEQMSAYFGHAMVATDLNDDGYDDLIVGAPMFVDPDNLIDRWEVGRVYVYCQDALGSFEKTDFLTGTIAGGQFGFDIAALGDVNRDGFNDIAIGAPFADSGIVYIYHGRRRGIKQTPAQVLRPIDFGLNIRSFGTSLAGGLDVDGNFYNDLLIGAYMSSTAVLVRSRPIVQIQRSLTFKPKQINLDTRDFTLPSGQTVSSFNLTTCLTARGLDIPNVIAVKYSLQLDAVLSTTSRVAFVLGNSFDESEVTRTVQLVTDVEKCQTDFVYVKLVIQNKVNPIAVRLSYELAPEATSIQDDAPAGNISTVVPPMLAPTTHPVLVESLLIRNTCKNFLCVPDLLLTASSNTKRVIVGDNWEANVEVSVSNYGEDAYEAAFQAVLPDGMTFVRVERISTDLSVTCSSEEDSGVVNCDIGNPLPEDHTVAFRLTLADDQLSGDSDKLVVSMNVGSLNYEPRNITADNYANVTIGVDAYAELGIYGGSNPQQVLYHRPSNTSFVPPEPETEEDVGPEVEHVYMLRNLGPSKVGRTRVDIYWPLVDSEGGYLLYVISAKVGTGENCWVQGGVNPENLEKVDNKNTSDTANLLTRKRRQSDSDSTAEVLPQVGSGVAMECYQVSPGCVLISCNMSAPSVVGVNEDSSIIRIRSKLYANTFIQRDYSQVLISSTANATVLAMPYRESILPVQFPTASSQVTTQVIVQYLETPGSPSIEVIVIPLWVYIVAIIGGSAILILVILGMWKCGFFKRKKIVPESSQAAAEETWQNEKLVDETE